MTASVGLCPADIMLRLLVKLIYPLVDTTLQARYRSLNTNMTATALMNQT